MGKLTSNKPLRLLAGIALAVIASVTPALNASATGTTTLTFKFNQAGQLADQFDSYIASGTVDQSADGGIGNSGAISTHNADASGVETTKAAFSLGPVGSTYTFSAFLKSEGNNGYSGFGFTASRPNADTTANTFPFRPNDGLGISVHGGGFVFQNETNNFYGDWNRDNSGITTISQANISDLLNEGSPDHWYHVIYVITRTSDTEFSTKVEVWTSHSNGQLLELAPSASFSMENQAAPALLAAPELYAYFNFSGYRVTYFDGFQVTVANGPVITGAPAGSVTDGPASLPTETTTSTPTPHPTTTPLASTGTNDYQVQLLVVASLVALWLGIATISARRRTEQK